MSISLLPEPPTARCSTEMMLQFYKEVDGDALDYQNFLANPMRLHVPLMKELFGDETFLDNSKKQAPYVPLKKVTWPMNQRSKNLPQVRRSPFSSPPPLS